METLVVGPDTVVEIYQVVLQLLSYILAASACLVALGYAFCLAAVWRWDGLERGEPGPGLHRGNPVTGPLACQPVPRRLHLVRSQG